MWHIALALATRCRKGLRALVLSGGFAANPVDSVTYAAAVKDFLAAQPTARPTVHAAMDAACEGLDTDVMLAFLHNVIDPLPSGQALNKRLGLD